MGLIFVDTETTGLEPYIHEVWEIALIEEDGTEHLWTRKPINLEQSDPTALRISGFYNRPHMQTAMPEAAMMQGLLVPEEQHTPDYLLAAAIVNVTAGHHLVGAVPSFDARFLESFVRNRGFSPAWHYHLVDVEAMAAGKLGMAPPWDSAELARGLGIGKLDGKHTAMGDARWAREMFNAALKRGH